MDGFGLDARGPVGGRFPATAPSAPAPFERPAPHGAVRFLRVLLIGIVVVPFALAIIGVYATYQSHLSTTEETLDQSVSDAAENTVKVLDTHRLVAARIDDLLAPLTDRQIHDQEQALHEQLSQQIKDLPEVAAAWALDASGRELVSAKVYPVDGDMSHAGREDFKALKNTGAQVFGHRSGHRV